MELIRKKVSFSKYKKTTYKDEPVLSIENICEFDKEEVLLQTYIQVTTENYREKFYYNSNHEDFNSICGDSLTHLVEHREQSKFNFIGY